LAEGSHSPEKDFPEIEKKPWRLPEGNTISRCGAVTKAEHGTINRINRATQYKVDLSKNLERTVPYLLRPMKHLPPIFGGVGTYPYRYLVKAIKIFECKPGAYWRGK